MPMVDQQDRHFIDVPDRPPKSKFISGSRTAAAGSGTQAVTGAGFLPTAIFLFMTLDGQVQAAWGFSDSLDAAGSVEQTTSATGITAFNSPGIRLNDNLGNSMEAAIARTSDGCNLVWLKGGAGMLATWLILFLG